jgi:chromosome segregation ATPase
VVALTSKLSEATNSLTNAQRENQRLVGEISSSSEDVKQKDADLRSTLKSLTEMQVKSMEEKCSLRAENELMKGRVSLLEEERLSITSQLAAKKEENSSYIRDNVEFREKVGNLEGKLLSKEIEVQHMKDAVMQLEVERELRARSELREEAERRERIAANAQLMAIQTECSSKLAVSESKYSATIESLKAERELAGANRTALELESRMQADLNFGMLKEIEQLKHALEHATSNHESLEALSRATGELEVLKRRLHELTENQECMVVTAAKKMLDY